MNDLIGLLQNIELSLELLTVVSNLEDLSSSTDIGDGVLRLLQFLIRFLLLLFTIGVRHFDQRQLHLILLLLNSFKGLVIILLVLLPRVDGLHESLLRVLEETKHFDDWFIGEQHSNIRLMSHILDLQEVRTNPERVDVGKLLIQLLQDLTNGDNVHLNEVTESEDIKASFG